MADDFDIKALLSGLAQHVRDELASKPDVVDVGDDLNLDTLAVAARRWARVDEIVAVVADLKGSTTLGTGKHAASTASIYEAAVRPLVQIFSDFEAGDIDIQGDAAFGVFWGNRRFERAMCAGITIKTFSQKHLEPKLEAKWPDMPKTGFKVGVAASRILVKRVGLPGTDYQEEVWAGKAVNYAAKAAQLADRRQLWVTDTVWNAIAENDYIVYSCGCNGGPSDILWADAEIDRLPEEDPDRQGRKLLAPWCDDHGPEFCAAILAGETSRPELQEFLRASHIKKLHESVPRLKAKKARELRDARLGRR